MNGEGYEPLVELRREDNYGGDLALWETEWHEHVTLVWTAWGGYGGASIELTDAEAHALAAALAAWVESIPDEQRTFELPRRV